MPSQATRAAGKAAAQVFVRSKSAYRGPDPVRAADQLIMLQQLYRQYGAAEFDKRMLWILRKNPEKGEQDVLAGTSFFNRRLVPFVHNAIQRDLDKTMTNRNILLKPRQAGYTTYCALDRLFTPAIISPGTTSMLISQDYKYATKHFEMIQRAYRNFALQDPQDPAKNTLSAELKQHLLHLRISNRKELIFDSLDSKIIIESAEVPEAGQGVTINHLHCSEVARWPGMPEETLANVKEAVAQDGTVDLESTANGMGGYFFEECMRSMRGDSEFTWHFHEWWWHEEYRRTPEVDPQTLDDQEKLLVKAHHIDMGQMAFRREKVKSLRHNFDEKYPEDPESCFLVVGGSFFDTDILKLRYRELQALRAEKVIPVDKYRGWEMYKKPERHRRYLIGADVASGKPSSEEAMSDLDYSTGWVLDLETGEQVAMYKKRILPEEFAWEMADLGKLYNMALIAVERNQEGGTVLLTLEIACQYTNVYKHKEWWKRDWKATREIIGFPTTPKTRPVALNRLRYYLMEDPEGIFSIDFIKEALTFVRDKNGKPAAAPGTHDDTVLAGAIAYYVRHVVLGYLDPLSVPKEGYGHENEESGESEPS